MNSRSSRVTHGKRSVLSAAPVLLAFFDVVGVVSVVFFLFWLHRMGSDCTVGADSTVVFGIW